MKVTLINTSDGNGGAAAACMRLLSALRLQHIDARLLVEHKGSNNSYVEGVATNFFSKLKANFNFLYERLPFIAFHEKDKSVRFAFSTAPAGISVKNRPIVQHADIVHLHWINSGFLSVNNLETIINTGKPIVWTLHDMWEFTGGCHYSGSCDNFLRECGNCPFLRDPGNDDISHQGWLRKAKMYAGAKNITIVTCSQWLAGVAGRSSLLKDLRIEAIPNPIDVEVFCPGDNLKARRNYGIDPNKKIILFGAANINDKRKGLAYLVEALHSLKANYPEATNTEVVIFGKNKAFDVGELPFPAHGLNIISSQQELAEIYSLADVFVSSALEDNLPNTIMEALACGTPVVAFDTGGIPEMIDHQQNGYLAKFRSAADLAKGMYEVLYGDNTATLATNARQKVLDNYTNEKVAKQYINLYQSLLPQ